MPADDNLLINSHVVSLVSTFNRTPAVNSVRFVNIARPLPWLRLLPPPVFYKGSEPEPATSGSSGEDVNGKTWWTLWKWLGPRSVQQLEAQYDSQVGLTIILTQGQNARDDWRTLPEPKGVLPRESGVLDAKLGEHVLQPNLDVTAGHLRLTLSFKKVEEGTEYVDSSLAESVKAALIAPGLTLSVNWSHPFKLRKRNRSNILHHFRPLPLTLVPILTHGHTPAPAPAPKPEPAPPPPPPPKDEDGTPIQESIETLLQYSADSPAFKGPDLSWKPLSDAPQAGRIWYRQSERRGCYYYLPTRFRFGFAPSKSLPTFQPYLFVRESAGELPSEEDYRVRLTLGAVPGIAPEDREYLRAKACEEAGLPYVDLEIAPDVVGRFSVEIGAAGESSPEGAAPLVDVEEGFAIQLEVPASSYTVAREQLLGHSGGITGNVFVTLDAGSEVSVPVSLSFLEVQMEALRLDVLPAEAGKGPDRLQMTNTSGLRVQVSDLRSFLVKRDLGVGGQPYQAKPGQLGATDTLPLTIEPMATREIQIMPLEQNWEWNQLAVSLGAISVADLDPQTLAAQWLDQINQNPANGTALYPASVLVLNISGLESSHPGLRGVKVRMFPVSGSAGDVDSALLSPTEDTWKTKIVRTLSQLSAGATETVWYELEFYSVYNDVDGLPQRVRCTDRNSEIRVLAFETSEARYRVKDASGAILAEDLDKAAAQARLAELRGAGGGWSLEVVAAAPTGTTTPSITVDPVALDFSGPLDNVYITLSVGPEDAPESASFQFSATAMQRATWTPVRFAAMPYRYELLYIFEGGRLVRQKGTGSSSLLVLLPPE